MAEHRVRRCPAATRRPLRAAGSPVSCQPGWDGVCAPTSVYSAYNTVSGRKEIFNDVKSGHANTPKAGEAMRQAILAHVEAMKKNRN